MILSLSHLLCGFSGLVRFDQVLNPHRINPSKMREVFYKAEEKALLGEAPLCFNQNDSFVQILKIIAVFKKKRRKSQKLLKKHLTKA